jgi:hypothetical protein
MQQGYQENNSQIIIDRLSPIKPDIPDLKDKALRLYLVKLHLNWGAQSNGKPS